MYQEKDAIRIMAKEGRDQNGFDIYIRCGNSEWEYLMSHRRNDRLFRLLCKEKSLCKLQKEAQKTMADIANKGKKRWIKGRDVRTKKRKNQSKRIEGSIRHVVGVINSYLQYEKLSA